ncbi:MAG: hypothetical protein IT350_09545 [Deltaproteobacteria bacterium]|nr:hypothetical protein [Deltaproteobacteria bacterium]
MTSVRRWFGLAIFTAIVIALATGCAGGGDDDDDTDSVLDDETGDDDDDDAGGPVDDNAREDEPVALIVTNADMADAWTTLADWKDRTGLRTDVVTIDDAIGSGASAADLQDYLAGRAAEGVRYVLLGGDADVIPYFRGYSEVWALEDYFGNAPIETYFEELDLNWDADGDGTAGEEDEDISLGDLRDPEIAVGRVPVQTADEAAGYVAKAIRYESGEGAVAERAISPIFLADTAASVPIVGDIDGGMMHEPLIHDYIPEAMQATMRRLYGTELYADLVGAEVGTTDLVREAFENDGYTYSVTNTHGDYNWLTLLMSRTFAKNLQNEVPFVFVTTSCLSGNFADKAYDNGDNPPQDGDNDDSVAEILVNNPDGGAVAYIGNALIGLGPVGGVQFNHALTRSIFVEGDAILGDALMNARRTLWSEVAYVTLGEGRVNFPMDMFPGAEWYTQRSVLLMGDPMLRIWTDTPGTLDLSVHDSLEAGYETIGVTVELDGAPASGIDVALSVRGGVLVRHSTDADGAAEFAVNLASGDMVAITAYGANLVASTTEYMVP